MAEAKAERTPMTLMLVGISAVVVVTACTWIWMVWIALPWGTTGGTWVAQLCRGAVRVEWWSVDLPVGAEVLPALPLQAWPSAFVPWIETSAVSRGLAIPVWMCAASVAFAAKMWERIRAIRKGNRQVALSAAGRIAVRIRWRMAVVAAVALLAIVTAPFLGFYINVPLRWLSVDVQVTCASTEVVIQPGAVYGLRGRPGLPWTGEFVGNWYYSVEPDIEVLSAWRSIPRWNREYNQGNGSATVPMLWILLPTAALALIGFRARRQMPPSGSCAGCGHLLAGAATCPECGLATEQTAKH